LAFCFTLAATIANMATWTVPPTAYHHAADKPNWYVAVDDCSSVADHVHADTTPAAIRPGLTDRPAEANSAALCGLALVKRF